MTIDTNAERAKLDALAGYTPGPWRMISDSKQAGYKVACKGKKMWGGGDAICSTRPALRSDACYDEAHDNARLIAAAPDLLTGYRAALDEIDRLRAALKRIRAAQYGEETP